MGTSRALGQPAQLNLSWVTVITSGLGQEVSSDTVAPALLLVFVLTSLATLALRPLPGSFRVDGALRLPWLPCRGPPPDLLADSPINNDDLPSQPTGASTGITSLATHRPSRHQCPVIKTESTSSMVAPMALAATSTAPAPPTKTEFPESWYDAKIFDAVEDVARILTARRFCPTVETTRAVEPGVASRSRGT